MSTPSTADMAAKHMEAAICLMGRDWCLQRLQSSAPNSNTSAATTAAVGQRGRKAGVVPPDDRRCAWQPAGRERCKNSHTDQGQYCKIHTVQIPLLDA